MEWGGEGVTTCMRVRAFVRATVGREVRSEE